MLLWRLTTDVVVASEDRRNLSEITKTESQLHCACRILHGIRNSQTLDYVPSVVAADLQFRRTCRSGWCLTRAPALHHWKEYKSRLTSVDEGHNEHRSRYGTGC